MRRKLLILSLIFSAFACEPSRARQQETPREIPSVTPIAPLPGDVMRGVCLAHNWQAGGTRGYGTAASAQALVHLKSVGVDTISVTPFGFMSGLDAIEVKGEHTGSHIGAGETRGRLERLAKQAKQAKMKVVLKPHIWVAEGQWRGQIQPKKSGELRWDLWWQSYSAFMLYYAKMAQDLGFEVLVVGVELASAVQHDPAPLKKLAEQVRQIYDGHVTYAANWNETVPDGIWKTFDSVGVQFYGPLSTDKPNPPMEVLREGVRKNLDPWIQLSRRVDRPLMLTEVGYRAANSAAKYPSAWPEKTPDHWSEYAPELQEKAYQALFLELAQVDQLQGVFIWKYFTDPETDEEGPDGFSPRGKLAEHVLKKAYQ